jgi:hypothetical protein
MLLEDARKVIEFVRRSQAATDAVDLLYCRFFKKLPGWLAEQEEQNREDYRQMAWVFLLSKKGLRAYRRAGEYADDFRSYLTTATYKALLDRLAKRYCFGHYRYRAKYRLRQRPLRDVPDPKAEESLRWVEVGVLLDDAPDRAGQYLSDRVAGHDDKEIRKKRHWTRTEFERIRTQAEGWLCTHLLTELEGG